MGLNDISVILVGAGNMGGALIGGWLANGVPVSQITIVDPGPVQAMSQLIAEKGINHQFNADGIASADVLVIAVKPQVMGEVLHSVRHLASENTVTISVAAGKTVSFISEHLGVGAIVRAMSNTPALIQRGISVACANDKVSGDQKQQTTLLLETIGSVEWVEDEALIDAVTAVSGSGPAYAFLLVEALGDAAISAGLPEKLGRRLALETVAGAGELMMRSKLSPSTLRENVTSPGGTTKAALSVLMGEGGFGELMKKAVDEAAKRSRELSRDD
ncbi:MAG: pyrroline-5-carboxylate reductase [Rhizobiaceae bacterium]|nr:pyrroline-5-carboxylate reductase [Rhizobiaceae bacterium]